MPVLSIIAMSFLTLSLTAGLTIALLPLGILRHQGWFSGSSEISLWCLLLLGGGIAVVLFALTSEAPFRKSRWTFAGSALLLAGVLLGVEIFLVQARPTVPPVTSATPVTPAAPRTISLWGLFLGCTALGVFALSAVEKAKRIERQAEEERAQEMERRAQAACAEARMRESLRFGRRNFAWIVGSRQRGLPRRVEYVPYDRHL